MVLMDEAEEEKEMRRSLILTREGDRDRGSGYGGGRMLSSCWQWYPKTTTKGKIRRGSGVYRQWGLTRQLGGGVESQAAPWHRVLLCMPVWASA